MIDRFFDFIETYVYPLFLMVLILAVVGLTLLPSEMADALKQLLGR